MPSNKVTVAQVSEKLDKVIDTIGTLAQSVQAVSGRVEALETKPEPISPAPAAPAANTDVQWDTNTSGPSGPVEKSTYRPEPGRLITIPVAPDIYKARDEILTPDFQLFARQFSDQSGTYILGVIVPERFSNTPLQDRNTGMKGEDGHELDVRTEDFTNAQGVAAVAQWFQRIKNNLRLQSATTQPLTPRSL